MCAMVSPCLLTRVIPLFSIDGVFNAIFVHGNMLGDAMFYGSGAGKLPTASAVVGDIVEEAKHLNKNLGVMWSEAKLNLESKEELNRQFFVRVKGSEATLKERICAVFGELLLINVEDVRESLVLLRH